MIFLASKYILGKSIITTIIISGGSVIPLGMIINIIILLVRGFQQSHWVGAKINFGQSCLLCMHNVEIEQLYENHIWLMRQILRGWWKKKLIIKEIADPVCIFSVPCLTYFSHAFTELQAQPLGTRIRWAAAQDMHPRFVSVLSYSLYLCSK